MKRYFLGFIFSSLYPCVPNIPVTPDFDDFTPLEKQKIAQSMPLSNPTKTIILPTMTVKFDIIVNGECIIYSCPVFTLDGVEVVCQVCGMPPCQIEVINGKLKCFCFNHIPRRRGRFLD